MTITLGTPADRHITPHPLPRRISLRKSLALIGGVSVAGIVCFCIYWSGEDVLPAAADGGRWDRPVAMPIVPAAAVVLPCSGKVLAWASDEGDVFDKGGEKRNQTLTVVFDPQSSAVEEFTAADTRHNMFCPGLSMDSLGQVVVTGGSTSESMSIFSDPTQWVSGPKMTQGRGYHSQVTLSDGDIFAIGGSWSGPYGGKHGEIFRRRDATWTALPGCAVDAMLTNDPKGFFCADNHAWLFGWKNGSVFQAGPSRAMNWYDPAGEGAFLPAGPRCDSDDSMNGNAVMFDAVRGKILTLGGAPGYSDSYGTALAHVITIDAPFSPVAVRRVSPMQSPRAYSNSVVLPTGQVFVNGGQSWAKQWTDANSTMTPELWDPHTEQFSKMTPSTVPRNYHSIALLLPDATVMTGGGGLCWTWCADPRANHLDMQRFLPPYLFNRDGSLASQPQILRMSAAKVAAGERLTVTTESQVHAFALVRYGSATHSINTDQRRVPLAAKMMAAAADGTHIYEVVMPGEYGILIPGYWMLFAISDGGVPSNATTLLVSLNQLANIYSQSGEK